MDENNIDKNEIDGPTFQRSLRVHKDTISQIIFNPNK